VKPNITASLFHHYLTPGLHVFRAGNTLTGRNQPCMPSGSKGHSRVQKKLIYIFPGARIFDYQIFKTSSTSVKFEVSTAVTMMIIIFFNLCSKLKKYTCSTLN
jgi:hypothetical protein